MAEVTAKVVKENKIIPLYQDPFRPVLKTSNPLNVNPEQDFYLRTILDVCCSDSKFAQKAYTAIAHILTGTGSEILPPVVGSISPNTAKLGDPSFVLHVTGENFDPDSLILWNGTPELTTYVSETELTTLVNMATATLAVDIPVSVQNGLGEISNSVTFALTDPVLLAAKKSLEVKPTVKKEEVKK